VSSSCSLFDEQCLAGYCTVHSQEWGKCFSAKLHIASYSIAWTSWAVLLGS